MIVLDAVLMAGLTAAIAGLLTWAICTQYRDAGSAQLRVRSRIRSKAKVTPLYPSETLGGSTLAL